MPDSPKERFLSSLKRCKCNDQFIPRFYDRFLSSSDEIRDKFKDTDFELQNLMLVRSLSLAAGATTGDTESLRELRERAETHDRTNLNISPHLYETWLKCVIATASEFDEEWSESIEESWNSILGYVVKHMTKHY